MQLWSELWKFQVLNNAKTTYASKKSYELSLPIAILEASYIDLSYYSIHFERNFPRSQGGT